MQFFKRLELNGFKSFAHKTSIEFRPGITVIVGPNGCGKSNIFDSIRWVLGESRIKSLRGDRMDDIIFGGSDLTKASGFAKVDLVLNNEDHRLPIDYSEVAVGRSIFKTGETEYRLNGNVCRRKDITGLFLDTGAGSNGYSAMEQGRVTQIINAKPLERRTIFDEAAGIARYKLNKEEALRKLERTQADLNRLNDVVVEVKRQVISLKRQAGKAARFRKYDSEIKTLEKERITRQWIDIKTVAAGINEECAALKAKVETLTAERDALDEALSKLRITIDKSASELEEKQGEQFTLSSSLNEAHSQLALADQKKQSDAARKVQLKEELTSLEAEAKMLTESIESHKLSITAQEEFLSGLQKEYEDKNNRYNEFRQTAEKSMREVSDTRTKIEMLRGTKNALENQISLADAMNDRLMKELNSDSEEFERLTLAVNDAESKKVKGQEALREAEEKLNAAKAEQVKLASELVACDNAVKSIVEELDSVRKKAHEAESRYCALDEIQKNYNEYYDAVRTVMVAARAGHLKGLIGTVTELLSVPQDLETAIEIALGGSAQNIVTDNSDDARAAVDFLKEHKSGRATFLSLDIIRPRGNAEKLRQAVGKPGVVGLATELVKYDGKYKDVIAYLLGGVLIVNDLNVAIRLNKEGLQCKIVSLQGDMIDPHGAITGGSIKSSGLLHRSRQLRESKEAAATLVKSVRRCENDANQLRDKRQKLREQHGKLGENITNYTIALTSAQMQCRELERIAGEQKSALDRINEHHEQIKRDMISYDNKKQDSLKDVRSKEEELKCLTNLLSEAEKSSEEDQQKQIQYQNEAHSALLQLSTERAKLSSLKDRFDNTRRDMIRVTETQNRRNEEIASLNAHERELDEEIVSVNQNIKSLEQKLSEIADQIKTDTAARNQLQTDLKEQNDKMIILTRKLNTATNDYNDSDLRSREENIRLRNLELHANEKLPDMSLTAIIAEVITRQRVQAEDEVPAADAPEDENEEAAEERELQNELSKLKSAVDTTAEKAMVEIDIDTVDLAHWQKTLASAEILSARLNDLRDKVTRLGPLNLGAIEEYSTLSERLEFLRTQLTDMENASKQLMQTISEIDNTSKELFTKAFNTIRENFQNCYRKLFGGGNADLILTDENGILDCGIDIIARPPGKKPANISLLSGGEQAMTAIALMFGIFMFKPSPFCILDEIDATLDDKNIERFKDMVKQFAHNTQFIIITHNKMTMTLANTIYGVTMQERGVSRIVSIKLDDYDNSELAS